MATCATSVGATSRRSGSPPKRSQRSRVSRCRSADGRSDDRLPAAMQIGVPKETAPDERRVALVPDVGGKLARADNTVLVQAGAGEGALIPDSQYEEAGARVVAGAAEAFGADVTVKVAPPTPEEVGMLRPD